MPPAFTSEEQALLHLSNEAVDALCEPAQADDTEALRKLYLWARVKARVYYARELKSEADAELLTSDFVEQFVRYLPTVRDSVSGWTHRVMLNRLLRLKKERQRQPLRPPLPEETQADPDRPDPAKHFEQAWIVELVFTVFFEHVARQDEPTRAAIRSRLREEKSVAALAARLGKTKHALSMQLMRFWERILKDLAQRMELSETERRHFLRKETSRFLQELIRRHDNRLDDLLLVFLVLLMLGSVP